MRHRVPICLETTKWNRPSDKLTSFGEPKEFPVDSRLHLPTKCFPGLLFPTKCSQFLQNHQVPKAAVVSGTPPFEEGRNGR
ncbi:hypothetical protein DPMN_075364 [Dreissena polymorpha]|uniref:Uncharacterized protein n=1 Tax=Dreissena polymorpha TaxID=45954 RepID=A0A9D3YK83_DREPO|nr:hypothetical protein DPMN_075364 [Dreissena polymorpha]